MRVLEPVVDELEKQTGLADGRLSHNNILEDVLVAHYLIILFALHISYYYC